MVHQLLQSLELNYRLMVDFKKLAKDMGGVDVRDHGDAI